VDDQPFGTAAGDDALQKRALPAALGRVATRLLPVTAA
jgi:hypothetical protein